VASRDELASTTFVALLLQSYFSVCRLQDGDGDELGREAVTGNGEGGRHSSGRLPIQVFKADTFL